MFLFQMVFMDTAATIPTGAMAERWKFSAFCVFGFFCSTLTYPVFGNWAWGGGWLSQLGANFGLGHGYADFAGSGRRALGRWLDGPGGRDRARATDRQVQQGRVAEHDPGPQPDPGDRLGRSSWPLAGSDSTLAARWAPRVAARCASASSRSNTMLAGAAASLAAMLYMWWTKGKPDPAMTVNGILAGLVAITAPSGFVSPVFAVIIGLDRRYPGVLGGVVLRQRRQGRRSRSARSRSTASAAPGASWRSGLFADGTSNYGGSWNGVSGSVTGLFFGDAGQFVAQIIGVIACFVYVCGLSYIFFRIVDRVIGMRTCPKSRSVVSTSPRWAPMPTRSTSRDGPAYPVVAASANGVTASAAAPTSGA